MRDSVVPAVHSLPALSQGYPNESFCSHCQTQPVHNGYHQSLCCQSADGSTSLCHIVTNSVKNFIPSEARLYSGSIDLFRRRRRRRRRHGPRPSQQLLQTYSLPNSQQTLTFVTELCTRDLEALTITPSLLQPVVFQAHYYT